MTADAIHAAYPLPTLREVRDTAPRCRIGHVAAQSADVVLLAGNPGDRSVLLVRRKHAPYAGLYALPGGRVEKGEQPLDAAERELREETGLVAPPLNFTDTYDGARRDPRLLTSHAFCGTVDEEAPPSAASDAEAAEWVPVRRITAGDVALAFDHPRILRDALATIDGPGSPCLAELESVIVAADRRNGGLLDEVERLFGRSIATDRDVLLAEYEGLKNESTQRIQQRDGFINLNLLAVAAVASFVANNHSASFALLAIPWTTLCFGWVYLANDEKITALGDYCEYHLGPKLGPEYLAWERSPKRATNIKRTHKTAQLLVDLLQFVGPVVGAPIVLWAMTGFDQMWVNIVAGVEIALGFALAVLFILGSHLTSRFDVKQEAWESL
jgi:ADP-ribose pyrophosphatase YjhB (NUDIX family)